MHRQDVGIVLTAPFAAGDCGNDQKRADEQESQAHQMHRIHAAETQWLRPNRPCPIFNLSSPLDLRKPPFGQLTQAASRCPKRIMEGCRMSWRACHVREAVVSAIESAYRAFCKERFPLPTAAQITELEQRLRVVLPPDYRQYLLITTAASSMILKSLHRITIARPMR